MHNLNSYQSHFQRMGRPSHRVPLEEVQESVGVADEKKSLSFDSDENILKLIVMMVAHLSEYTEPLTHSLNW